SSMALDFSSARPRNKDLRRFLDRGIRTYGEPGEKSSAIELTALSEKKLTAISRQLSARLAQRSGSTPCRRGRYSEPAAGDGQRLAGDVPALLAGKEQDGVRHLLRPADAADRDLLLVGRQHFRLEAAQHRRLDHARRHGVDRDAALRQLLRHHLRQRD